MVTTIAGVYGNSGHMDGGRGTAKFFQPRSLVIDTTNNVAYVADTSSLRKVVLSTGKWASNRKVQYLQQLSM